MLIKANAEIVRDWLTEVINRFLIIGENELARILPLRIVVIATEEIDDHILDENQRPSLRNAAIFGAIHRNVSIDNEDGRIVLVLNLTNLLDMTIDQINALIAHEIGHILNPPVVEAIPVLTGPELWIIRQEAMFRNRLNNELEADNYAVQLGLRDGLVKLIEAFTNVNSIMNEETRNIFQGRLRNLM